MKLRDLVGKRVELLEDECWSARNGFITAGHRGTVEQVELVEGQQPLVHIDFDRIKPRDGFYFGLGCADWEFNEWRQKRLRVIEEAA